jgi:hypothetical protein
MEILFVKAVQGANHLFSGTISSIGQDKKLVVIDDIQVLKGSSMEVFHGKVESKKNVKGWSISNSGIKLSEVDLGPHNSTLGEQGKLSKKCWRPK